MRFGLMLMKTRATVPFRLVTIFDYKSKRSLFNFLLFTNISHPGGVLKELVVKNLRIALVPSYTKLLNGSTGRDESRLSYIGLNLSLAGCTRRK